MLFNQSDTIIRICVIGAGNRGTNLAVQVKNHFPFASIAAVAEPNEGKRAVFCKDHSLEPDKAFISWKELVSSNQEFDAAIIATMDNQHTDPAIAVLKKGWHLLLEKPMAHTLQDCIKIDNAQKESGKMVSVCHTLRYRPEYQRIKDIVDSGIIGEIVTVEHLEAIGNIRFTHNYVRGRWGNEQDNTFLLLHKSSHDIDFLSWIIGGKCKSVSSFGGIKYFNSQNAPNGSTNRCTDSCRIEESCIYSALRLYVNTDLNEWPAKDVPVDHTKEAHLLEIQKGPYGKCVWRSDNNVVDHQVVALEFEGGATATFTMSGFTSFIGRQTRIHGTKGDLFFDEANQFIKLSVFGQNSSEIIEFPEKEGYHPEDKEIVGNWLNAIVRNDLQSILVDTTEALENHSIVFAAEKSRLEGKMIQAPFIANSN
ncbi:MAG: Gfo/Idh/MocA family oxidoreductase [Bacteroidales bacterium]|nr:Gfo/Idh/MocA family oxidoreductase [Bacteroidales bacterium]